MATTSKKNGVNVDILPPLYKCSCCGKTFQDPHKKFFKVIQNPLYKGNDSYGTICTSCCDTFFSRMKEVYKDEKLALLLTCSAMGWYFSETIYSQIKSKDISPIRLGVYVKTLNLSQNKEKNFTDCLVQMVSETQPLKEQKIERIEEETVEEWTEEEKRNVQDVIEIVGYDVFAGYPQNDRKYLFGELVKYLDEDVIDDTYKLSQIIQIVNNNNQIRRYDLLISQLRPLEDSESISTLNGLKSRLVSSNDKIAKENEISVKNRSNKDAGKSTLTYLMKELREKNFDKAETDYYDQLRSAGTHWAADVSMQAIQKNTFFDENDINEIKNIRRELVSKLQEQVDELMEEKRQLLVKIQDLETRKNE